MTTSEQKAPRILPTAWRFWNERRMEKGVLGATGELSAAVWEFVRDSTPARLRSRFGDADYDWDHTVNTTSGAVGWRDRLLGTFHSLYQPTDPANFQDMIEQLRRKTDASLEDFTFVDLGSGKGRTLLMASHYPFRRILGVELLPSLHRIAVDNLAQYKSDLQRCFALESICADATTVPMPEGPLLVYLFHPFLEAGLRRVLQSLKRDLETHPRPVYLLYLNPQLEHLVLADGFLKKIAGTHQYSIFAA